MNKQPTVRKMPLIWIILATPIAILLLCIATTVAIAPFALSLLEVYSNINSQIPQIRIDGNFENGVYTAPEQNFSCVFPWQSVSGESLTDMVDKNYGMVKYNSNDFEVNITIEYRKEEHVSLWPQDHNKRAEFLEALYNTVTLPGLEGDFGDVVVVYSEHRSSSQQEFFAVSKFYTGSDETSLSMRGDLLFIRNEYFYEVTYARRAWTWGDDELLENQWVNAIDKVRTDSGSLTFSRQCIADEFLV